MLVEDEEIVTEKNPRLIPSVRILLAIMCFSATLIQYTQRINMSVAIVCMVNHTAVDIEIQQQSTAANETLIALIKNKEAESKCYNIQHEKASPLDGTFVWSKQIQGQVLSAFFYGHIISQVFGAVLSVKFGSIVVSNTVIFIGSVLTIFVPFAARYDYLLLISTRFVTGFAHGMLWPAISTLWSFWAPPEERSTLMSIARSGSQLGNVVALPLGGYLCVHGFDGGWPSLFYVLGIAGIVWCILSLVLTSSKPHNHRFISQKEMEYIQTKITGSVEKQSKVKTPWKSILTSKIVYAIILTQFCSNFCTYVFLTQLPTYMREVLKFDIQSNGFLSSIPYILFWLFIILSGILSDHIIKSGRLSRTCVRKMFNTTGFLVPMMSMICLIFVTCEHPYVGVFFVSTALAFSGLTYGSGFLVAFNDIGGRFSGIVFSVSNTIGMLSGVFAPYVVALLTPTKTQAEWRIVFSVTAVMYLIGALAFLIFADCNIQPWAMEKKKERTVIECKPLKI